MKVKKPQQEWEQLWWIEALEYNKTSLTRQYQEYISSCIGSCIGRSCIGSCIGRSLEHNQSITTGQIITNNYKTQGPDQLMKNGAVIDVIYSLDDFQKTVLINNFQNNGDPGKNKDTPLYQRQRNQKLFPVLHYFRLKQINNNINKHLFIILN